MNPIRERRLDADHEPTLSPEQTVMSLRFALRDGDARAVRDALLWDPRPPWERDLLVDLIAAEGIDTAVAKLQRFWCRASFSVTGVRRTHGGDAEVYEEVGAGPGGGRYQTVTLLRRLGHRYRVVHTADAPIDQVRITVSRRPGAGTPDDSGFTREWQVRNGRTAEWVMDGDEGALGHPGEGWLARVRGPRPSSPGAGAAGISTAPAQRHPETLEITMPTTDDAGRRAEQLLWLAGVVAAMAEHDGAPWVHFHGAGRRVGTRELQKAVLTPGAASARLAATWVGMAARKGWAATRGMGQLRLPEVEVQLPRWPDVAVARRFVGTVAMSLLGGRAIRPGAALLRIDGVRCRVEPGRRGPAPGESYGRWGSLLLVPAVRRGDVSRSGTRMRLGL